MNTLKRFSPLFSTNKNDCIYSSYKYDDIKPEWIIHEGNLEYLSDDNILKKFSFKKYFIVITSISNGINENMIILYLYTHKNKNPYKFFNLNQNDRFNDRCNRITTEKTGLFFFELILNDSNKGEIFGAYSDLDRKLWLQKFHQAISMLKTKTITRSASDISSQDNHERVKSSTVLRSNSDSSVKPTIRQYKQPREINNYDEAKIILPEDLPEDETRQTVSSQIFSWNDIYYNNTNNDFQSVLNKHGKSGMFLIRPSSEKTNTYVLCVYDAGYIHELEINCSSVNHQYSLTNRKIEPSFIDINQLCQYYTNYPLYIPLEDGSDKLCYLSYPYNQQYL